MVPSLEIINKTCQDMVPSLEITNGSSRYDTIFGDNNRDVKIWYYLSESDKRHAKIWYHLWRQQTTCQDMHPHFTSNHPKHIFSDLMRTETICYSKDMVPSLEITSDKSTYVTIFGRHNKRHTKIRYHLWR